MATNQGKIISACLQDESVLAIGSNSINVYNKGYYGRPEAAGIRLNGFEALHLLEMQRIQICDDDKLHSTNDVAKYFELHIEDFMLRYHVYKDLRTRGYVVNLGQGSAFFFRLYDRNAKPGDDPARYYVRPLNEGGSIELQHLEDLIGISQKSQKTLLIGMVDAVGDVSYLTVNKLIPEELSQEKPEIIENWDWDLVWKDFLTWDD